MKNFRNLKQGVFTLGFLSFILGVFVTIATTNPMVAFFPLYIGLFFMGSVMLHKEKNVNPIIQN
mgnify:CR=1 FL=1